MATPPPSTPRRSDLPKAIVAFLAFLAACVLVSVCAVVLLALLGPSIGNPFPRLMDTCAGAIAPAASDGTLTFEGYYVAQFEVSSFVPCGCSEESGYGAGYWLQAKDRDFWNAYDRLLIVDDPFTPGPKVYVRFQGSISEYGSFGHLGLYPREVTVSQLLDMSPNSTCADASAKPRTPLP